MAPRPQNQMYLILRLFKVMSARLDVDGDARMYPLNTNENREWDHDEVVLVLAENAANFFYNPTTMNSSLPIRMDLPRGSMPRNSSRTSVLPISQMFVL